MAQNQALPVMAIYRLKKGTENQFLPLLAKHWPTLKELGLVTQDKPKFWKSRDKKDGEKISFVEVFSWKDAEAPNIAHQTPEVMRVWEPMGPLLEGLEIMHLQNFEV